jgi:hypothetical protein
MADALAATNLNAVPYATADARQQLLDTLADAIEDLARALASLSEAYELLDENSAEKLEQALFVPVQVAYGRAQQTYARFADRVGLPARAFAPSVAGAPGKGVKGFLDDAVQAVSDANGTLATLQDSMLPVEVGDAQLRAGLEQVRTHLDGVGARARELVRTIGR